jgi:carboxyl-terminal processing protease
LESRTDLIIGSISANVKKAEQILKAKGFSITSPDKNFDNETAKAVKAYQKLKKLKITGKIDKSTSSALNADLVSLRSQADPQYVKAVQALDIFSGK